MVPGPDKLFPSWRLETGVSIKDMGGILDHGVGGGIVNLYDTLKSGTIHLTLCYPRLRLLIGDVGSCGLALSLRGFQMKMTMDGSRTPIR